MLRGNLFVGVEDQIGVVDDSEEYCGDAGVEWRSVYHLFCVMKG